MAECPVSIARRLRQIDAVCRAVIKPVDVLTLPGLSFGEVVDDGAPFRDEQHALPDRTESPVNWRSCHFWPTVGVTWRLSRVSWKLRWRSPA